MTIFQNLNMVIFLSSCLHTPSSQDPTSTSLCYQASFFPPFTNMSTSVTCNPSQGICFKAMYGDGSIRVLELGCWPHLQFFEESPTIPSCVDEPNRLLCLCDGPLCNTPDVPRSAILSPNLGPAQRFSVVLCCVTLVFFIFLVIFLIYIPCKCCSSSSSYRVEPAYLYCQPPAIDAVSARRARLLEGLKKLDEFSIPALVLAGFGSKDTIKRYLARMIDEGTVQKLSDRVVTPGSGGTPAKYTVI